MTVKAFNYKYVDFAYSGDLKNYHFCSSIFNKVSKINVFRGFTLKKAKSILHIVSLKLLIMYVYQRFNLMSN